MTILGLDLPDMDGLDLLSIMIAERLACRLLVVSSRRDERAWQQLRPGRINGFFDPQREDHADLACAIRRVAEGGVYFSRDGSGAEAPAGRIGLRLDQMFTSHELRVFATIADGCNDEDAGTRLGLHSRTVHNHRQKIMRKLEVRTRVELICEALRRGIVRIMPDRVLRPGFDWPPEK